MTRELIWIIDADVRRRASITFYLNNAGFFAEPFETVEEFLQSCPKSGLALAHDDAGMVSSLVQSLSAQHILLPVVSYAENPTPTRIVNAVLNGAVGFAAWPGCGDKLVKALSEANARSTTLISTGARQIQATTRIERLSPRERQILAGMADGLSNREIGDHLEISHRTVELHRSNLLIKTGAKHSAEAIRWAIEASLPPFVSSPSTKLLVA